MSAEPDSSRLRQRLRGVSFADPDPDVAAEVDSAYRDIYGVKGKDSSSDSTDDSMFHGSQLETDVWSASDTELQRIFHLWLWRRVRLCSGSPSARMASSCCCVGN